MRSAPSKDVPPNLNVRTRPVDARAGYANAETGRLGSAINSSCCSGLMATAPVVFLPPVGASYSDQGANPETWEGGKRKTHRQVRFRRWVRNFACLASCF